MLYCLRIFLLLLAALLASSIISTTSDYADEDCGEIQHNVENGMIRLPEFSGEAIKDINCSWTYVASPGRKLLVKVDSVQLPPSDLRTSSFQLYIDDQIYDIPRNCVKCLKEMVGGKIIKVLFSSLIIPFTEDPLLNNNESAFSDSIGSFQVRYKSFDPHRCSKPEQIENGFLISKGRKVGQSIFYRCNPPYDLFGDSESQCTIPKDSPVPEWNTKIPKCTLQDCNNDPVIRESSSGSIASPGYPSYIHEFNSLCQWIVMAQSNQQIKVSVTYLQLPNFSSHILRNANVSRLSLFDGDSTSIVNLTESISNGSLNFTTKTNKLKVEFFVSENHEKKEEVGFYLDYSAISSTCPKPQPPDNGAVIDYNNDFGSTISYRCDQGYVLVGELHAECLLNGQWSHPTPICESLTIDSSFYIGASNDSETVKFPELPKSSNSSLRTPSIKPPKSEKKKAKEYPATKMAINFTEFKTASPETKNSQNEELFPFEREKLKENHQEKTEKKNHKENGPKSEPHLLQVIPPKSTGKKISTHPITMDIGKDSKPDVSKNSESIPDPEVGVNRDDDNSKYHPVLSVTVIFIIAGVGAPALVAVILLVSILIYRRRYPVRMRFGRKFSTFENPMYITKDAQHPRELKRLTT